MDRQASRKWHARSDGHADPQGRHRVVGGTETIDDDQGRGGSGQAQHGSDCRGHQRNGTAQANGYRRRRRKCGKPAAAEYARPNGHAAIS